MESGNARAKNQDHENGEGKTCQQIGGVPSSEEMKEENNISNLTAKNVLQGLGWLDRFLSVFIIFAMSLGVVIGILAPRVRKHLNKGYLNGVSAPLVIGLIVMMWPILTKVPYETFGTTFKDSKIWLQIFMSLLLNWVLGPFLMLGIAWATLPDLEEYRIGIIMVGLARCIAMVMIWNKSARGDSNVCAILVILNSVLQIVLYAPYCIWFINVISGSRDFTLDYANTAVLIYLGIPLTAGCFTRFIFITFAVRTTFEKKFLPFFGPLSLVGLLYTIIIIFAEQARHILDNLGPTFRTFVPLVLYFAIIRRYGHVNWDYQMAVVQAFTAGSNNFELAIAVSVSVPVLLTLSWIALYAGK
ncbi:arsenical-resistance protein [Meira miltonrushii]|uniref:Arsenical-resistance protein n=1 Tax=Meira miltonrushii TaxID=1280837 RepID=A0A316V1L5_9BASI|nr:arsenical-resistance protein [Meira miltonrushii]PWN31362.1 arsenical-resistance protein [Meira miltonrushii]